MASLLGEQWLRAVLGDLADQMDLDVIFGRHTPTYEEHPLYNEVVLELHGRRGESALLAALDQDIADLRRVGWMPTGELLQHVRGLKDRQWNNAWAGVAEIHALAVLARALGVRPGPGGTTERGGKPDFSLPDYNIVGDVKTLTHNRVDYYVEMLHGKMYRIREPSPIGTHLGLPLQALRDQHFQGSGAESLRVTLQELGALAEDGPKSRITRSWEPEAGVKVTFELRPDRSGHTAGGSGETTKNATLKLQQRILDKPTQFQDSGPNLRVLVHRLILMGGVTHRLRDVLYGYPYAEDSGETFLTPVGKTARVARDVWYTGLFSSNPPHADAPRLSGLLLLELPTNGRPDPPSLFLNRYATHPLPGDFVDKMGTMASVVDEPARQQLQ